MDTTNELLAGILDAAGCIEKREDQLRRTTRDVRTPVAKCSEGDCGILELLLWTVTNWSSKHQVKINSNFSLPGPSGRAV